MNNGYALFHDQRERPTDVNSQGTIGSGASPRDGQEFDGDQIQRMKKDRFICNLIGIELVEAGKGRAVATLDLRPDHLNGVGIVQGGVLFSLADYVFAAAANYAEEVVGIESSISFLQSVKEGKIKAEAVEVSRTGRFATCQVRVTDETDRLLAVFTGRGYVLKKR